MKFDFEILQQPEKYHRSAVVMSRLTQKATDETDRIADVDDGVTAYCIVGQISQLSMASTESEGGVGLIPTTKKTDRDTSKQNTVPKPQGGTEKR